jgi:hypothetical protein
VAIGNNNSPKPLSITRVPRLKGYGTNLAIKDKLHDKILYYYFG